MKAFLTLVVVAVSIAVTSAALTCMGDENKCAEDECCIKVSNLIGMCQKLRQEGETCQTHPLTMIFKKHVSLFQCPCAEGLQCVAKDGLFGKVLGECRSEDSDY